VFIWKYKNKIKNGIGKGMQEDEEPQWQTNHVMRFTQEPMTDEEE